MISFLLLTLGFVCSSFSSCFWCKVTLFIWDFSLPYILRCSYVGCIYIYNCFIFLDWFLDHHVVSFSVSYNSLYFKVYFSGISIATPAFFLFPSAWNIFFHPLTFSLCMSLDLRWVSYRQHRYGSCFVSIQPVCVFWFEHLVHLHLR